MRIEVWVGNYEPFAVDYHFIFLNPCPDLDRSKRFELIEKKLASAILEHYLKDVLEVDGGS